MFAGGGSARGGEIESIANGGGDDDEHDEGSDGIDCGVESESDSREHFHGHGGGAWSGDEGGDDEVVERQGEGEHPGDEEGGFERR